MSYCPSCAELLNRLEGAAVERDALRRRAEAAEARVEGLEGEVDTLVRAFARDRVEVWYEDLPPGPGLGWRRYSASVVLSDELIMSSSRGELLGAVERILLKVLPRMLVERVLARDGEGVPLVARLASGPGGER